MKHIYRFSLRLTALLSFVAILAAGPASGDATAERARQRSEMMTAARLKTHSGAFEEARTLYEALLEMPDSTLTERINALNAIAGTFTRARPADPAAARAVYERILVLPDAQPAHLAAAHVAIAGAHLHGRTPDVAAAVAACERGLALENLGAAERYRLRNQIGDAWKRVDNFTKVIMALSPVLDDADAGNNHKLAAINTIANAMLDTFDEAGALERARTGLDLPDLTPTDQALALENLGKLLQRMERFDEGRAEFSKITLIEDLRGAGLRAARASAAAFVDEQRFDEAARLLREADVPLEEADLRHREGQSDLARQIAAVVLEDPATPDVARWSALVRIVNYSISDVQFDVARRAWEKHAPSLVLPDPQRHGHLVRILATAMRRGDYAFSAWAAPETLKAPRLTAQQLYTCHLYHVNANAALGRLPTAAAAAAEAAEVEALAPNERLQFRIAAAALAFSGKPGELEAAVAAMLQNAAEATPDTHAESVAKAAGTAMMANREQAARDLHVLHESLFVPEPRPVYRIPFMDRAPASIDAYLASPLAADESRRAHMIRQFGGNLELVLATDVSTGDRAVTVGEATELRDDEAGGHFTAVCDADGIHFYITAPDSNARAVAAGMAGGGSYEGYFAPGRRQAYVCFLVNLQNGRITTWQSMYDNLFHRQPQSEAGNFAGEHRIAADRYHTHLFFSWELYYDKLPEPDDVWEFDVIRWSSVGGRTWSGTKTVHGRSTWGDVVFAITSAERTAIKRNLLYKAFARYAREKITRGDHAGLLDFWQDEVLGDPDFYAEALAPMRARFDELAPRVTLEMSDAEVDEIYDEAGPTLLGLRFVIDAKRARHLERRRF